MLLHTTGIQERVHKRVESIGPLRRRFYFSTEQYKVLQRLVQGIKYVRIIHMHQGHARTLWGRINLVIRYRRYAAQAMAWSESFA